MEEVVLTNKLKEKVLLEAEKRGLTLYKLAEMADISHVWIRNWDSKRNYKPSLYSIMCICDALGISLSQFFLSENEELFPLKEEEKELFNNWLVLTPEQKNVVMSLIRSYHKE